MSQIPHTSVLPNEVLDLLAPSGDSIVVDGTLGAAGHTLLIARAIGAQGRVLAIDKDLSAHRLATERLDAERAADAAMAEVSFVHGGFGDIDAHLANLGIDAVDGMLLDLGVSSMQLDRRERGFSFVGEGPIDMRMDSSQGPTALEYLQEVSEVELARVLFEYGEERYSRRIAQRLKADVASDSLHTTLDLADAISRCIPAKSKQTSKIHPATRSFQAIRIAVNGELDELERFLDVFHTLLRPGGRCAIISFHSLEDRLVKRAFRDLTKTSNLPPHLAERAGERVHPLVRLLTKKPLVASSDEIQNNSRSRSAKLRACEKVSRA